METTEIDIDKVIEASESDVRLELINALHIIEFNLLFPEEKSTQARAEKLIAKFSKLKQTA